MSHGRVELASSRSQLHQGTVEALLGWAVKTLPAEQVETIKQTLGSKDFSRIKPMLLSILSRYNEAMNYSNYRLF